jgi:hypothetical protein
MPSFEREGLTSTVGDRAEGIFAGFELSKKYTDLLDAFSCEIAIPTQDDAIFIELPLQTLSPSPRVNRG